MIRLLLVEDDANLCYIIQGGLEDMIGGYEVTTAANGEEGLRVWREQKPDVIVSDIEMPVMDGYEMVRRIRETDGDTPILFTSGRVSPKDVVMGYELGGEQLYQETFSCRRTECTYYGFIETDERNRTYGTRKRVSYWGVVYVRCGETDALRCAGRRKKPYTA